MPSPLLRSPSMSSPGGHGGHPDRGFTLIEAVVAVVLLIVMAVTVLSAVLATTKLADQARSRTVATELATREVAAARTLIDGGDISTDDVLDDTAVENPTPLDGGVVGDDLVVGGTSFTVSRRIGLSAGTEGQSLCVSGITSVTGQDALMVRIEVSVTWSTRTTLAPVDLVEYVGLPNGLKTGMDAIVVVRVIDPTQGGAGVSGAAVTLQSSSWYYSVEAGTTDQDGCVVGRVPKKTVQVTTNTYTVVATKPGYVGQAWTSTAAFAIGRPSYASALINRVTLSYAPSAALRVHLTTEDGTAAATDAEAAGQQLTLICASSGTAASAPGWTTELTGAVLEVAAVWPCEYSAYVGTVLPSTMEEVEAVSGTTTDIWVRPGYGIVPAPGSPGAPTATPTPEPEPTATEEPDDDSAASPSASATPTTPPPPEVPEPSTPATQAPSGTETTP